MGYRENLLDTEIHVEDGKIERRLSCDKRQGICHGGCGTDHRRAEILESPRRVDSDHVFVLDHQTCRPSSTLLAASAIHSPMALNLGCDPAAHAVGTKFQT